MKPKKKKRKIRIKGLIIILLFIYLIGMLIYYLFTMPVKNIIVKNNILVKESDIIEIAKINETTPMVKVNTISLRKKLKKNLPIIHDVSIKKNLLGTITITIEENKLLFYNVLTNELVLSDGTKIKDGEDYLGYGVLVNYVPSDIFDRLVKGFATIDKDIIAMISEIEYSPDKYNDVIIDDERFLLRMNDGNSVYINIVNIEKLNKYQTIYATVGGDGILYLDSSSKNYIFKTKEEQEPMEEEEVNEN